MEEYVLGTGRVLEDREDCSHGSADVCCVEGHCNVDHFLGADHHVLVVAVGIIGSAIWGVVELRGFFELAVECGGSVCGIVGGRGWTGLQEEG